MANQLGRSTGADASVICEYADGHLSIRIEQQTLSQLAAELNSGSSRSTSGVLLGIVALDGADTRIEVGACMLFRDTADEAGMEAELRNYTQATPRAPGCVGYFSIGSVNEHNPVKSDEEVFLKRFNGAAQVFLFARRSETGDLSAQFYRQNEGRLVPLPMSVVRRDKALATTLIPLWPVDLTKRKFWGLSAVLALAAAGAVAFLFRAHTPVEATPATRLIVTPELPDPKPFQLTVSKDGGSLTLLWDPEAAAVRDAQHGVLVVEDGERDARQSLDRADLRNGKLVYVPSEANVRFQIVLLSSSGTVETASVRILGLTPRSLPSPAVVPQPDADAIRSRVATVAPVSTKNVPAQLTPAVDPPVEKKILPVAAPPAVEEQKPTPAPPAVEEQKPTPAPPSPVTISDTKPTPAETTQASVIAPQTLERPPVTQPEPHPSVTPARLPISQAAQEPRVKRKVNPSIPLGLQSALRNPSRTPIVIPVRVRIDASGSATSAHAEQAPSGVLATQLANIATTTAKYWSFYPATINGKPVSSELVISFKF